MELVKQPVAIFPDEIKSKVLTLTAAIQTITTITDEPSRALAESKTKEASVLVKSIADSRMKLTRPLDERKKEIMDLEKSIVAPLQTAIETASKFLTAYAQKLERDRIERERKLKEEAAEKFRIEQDKIRLEAQYKEKVLTFKSTSINAINGATLGTIDNIANVLSDYQVAGKFGVYEFEAVIVKLELMQLCEARRELLIDAFTNPEAQLALEHSKQESEAKLIEESQDLKMETSLKEQDAAINIDIDRQAKEAVIPMASGMRKVWEWELLELGDVPLQYLCLDETAVRKAIMEGVRDIPGLKISQELKRSGR